MEGEDKEQSGEVVQMTVREGDDVTVHCKDEAKPASFNYHWRHNVSDAYSLKNLQKSKTRLIEVLA